MRLTPEMAAFLRVVDDIGAVGSALVFIASAMSWIRSARGSQQSIRSLAQMWLATGFLLMTGARIVHAAGLLRGLPWIEVIVSVGGLVAISIAIVLMSNNWTRYSRDVSPRP